VRSGTNRQQTTSSILARRFSDAVNGTHELPRKRTVENLKIARLIRVPRIETRCVIALTCESKNHVGYLTNPWSHASRVTQSPLTYHIPAPKRQTSHSKETTKHSRTRFESVISSACTAYVDVAHLNESDGNRLARADHCSTQVKHRDTYREPLLCGMHAAYRHAAAAAETALRALHAHAVPGIESSRDRAARARTYVSSSRA